MKILCLHGYFKFEEQMPGEFSSFADLYDMEFARAGDHFTFAGLEEAPDFSLAGGTYLGAPATKTFEGAPWDVMRENELVYDFTKGLVVPRSLVARSVKISEIGNYYFADGMIVPGSLTDDGKRVTDYAAYFLFDRLGFKYSEVESV